MTISSFGSPSPHLNGTAYGQVRDTPVRDTQRDGSFDLGRSLGSNLGPSLGDEPMDRIRELLFGEMRRVWEARLQTLETRLQLLEDKLDALKHETKTAQQGQLSTLAEGIDQLGQHVRRLTRS